MSDVEAICREFYRETRRKYDNAKADLGSADLGFRILYGPPTVGAPYLFIGYQPGGQEIEDEGHHETWPQQCDYATKDWPLAKKVRYIWGNDVVARCTGLNAIFFRAPSVKAWRSIASPLRHQLEDFSLQHAQAIVGVLQPKQLILIGLGTFDSLLEGNPCLHGHRGRVLAKKGTLWGRSTTGTIHLSGAQISNVDRDRLRNYFSPQISN